MVHDYYVWPLKISANSIQESLKPLIVKFDRPACTCKRRNGRMTFLRARKPAMPSMGLERLCQSQATHGMTGSDGGRGVGAKHHERTTLLRLGCFHIRNRNK
jgi:hypothetical protein